jgi:hypothetical protein
MILKQDIPISFLEVSSQYIFSKGEQCVALGEYNNGDFYIMEDDDVDMFPNAMTAFCYLNEKHRSLRR